MSIVWGHYSVDPKGIPGGLRPDRACMQDIYQVRETVAVQLPRCYIYDILYYDADGVLERKYAIRQNSCFSVLLLAGERVRIYAASSDPIDLSVLESLEFQACNTMDFSPAKALSSARHIKLIGDSITAGSGGSGYVGTGVQFVTDPPVLARTENLYGVCWANFLKYRLERDHGCTVKNWGTAKYASQHLSLVLPQLIEEEDDLIVCTIGTNDRLLKSDTITAFSDRLRSILAFCAAKGKRIIMMSPIPSSREEGQEGLAYTLADVRDAIAAVCSQAGVPFLDLQAQFQAELSRCGLPLQEVLGDGLHPNDIGYYLMYRAVCTLLELPVPQNDARTLAWEADSSGKAWRSLPLTVQPGDGLYLPPERAWHLECQDSAGMPISMGDLAQGQVRKVLLYTGTVVVSTEQDPETASFSPYVERELLPLRGNNMPAADYYFYRGQTLFSSSECKESWPFSNLLLPGLCNESGAVVSMDVFTRRILDGEIVLPTWNILPVSESMWTHPFQTVIGSSKLWQFSLFWITAMLGVYEQNPDPAILTSVEQQLIWFFAWLNGDYDKLGFPGVPSADHSCAVRCTAMSNVLRVFPEEWSLRSQVVTLLAHDCEWMCNPNMKIRNNHGIIMLEGLLHVVALLRERPRDEACYRNTLIAHVESEMMEIYKAKFDGEGLCRENTIGYHNFNLVCFDELIALCRDRAIPIDLTPLLERMERSREVTRQLIWQDNCVPPVGDGHVLALPCSSINQDHFYREGNWLIRKDDQRYFSYKCGFTLPAHKHVDEGSLTLRYCGREILIDSGSYNYDRHNPIRQYVESARGHCGLYPRSLYPLLSPEYVKTVHQASAIDYYEEVGQTTIAHGFYELKSGFRAERRVTEHPGELLIEDSFRCGEAEDVDLRFCLHPDSKIERICSDHKLVFQNQDIYFSIEILDASSNVKLTMKDGHYSPELQQDMKAPVCTATFFQTLCGEIKTKIQYGRSLSELLDIPPITQTLRRNRLTTEISAPVEPGAMYSFSLYQDGHCIQTLPPSAEPKHTFELSADGIYCVGATIHRPAGQCARQLMSQSSVYHEVGKPSISIYGSCVSRDIFELAHDTKFELKAYIARQSVISAVAPKIPEGKIVLQNPSPFRLRAVVHDFAKDTFEVLKESKSDYLLLDLIDERFPLLSLFDSYVTASNEFYESVPEQYRSTKKLSKSIKDGELYVGNRCVEDAVMQFCTRLKEIYSPEQIIIHYATMLDQYRSTSGKVKTFPPHQLRASHQINAVMETICNRMKFYLPGVHVIHCVDGIVAEENHKWGLAPMHYEQKYYERVLRRLYEYSGLCDPSESDQSSAP